MAACELDSWRLLDAILADPNVSSWPTADQRHPTPSYRFPRGNGRSASKLTSPAGRMTTDTGRSKVGDRRCLMKAILSLAPFGFRSFHRAFLYPDSREDVVDAVRVDVNGRGLRSLEFWNRATNTLRYAAEDAEAKQVQEAFDGANQDAEPDRLKDDDRRGNRPTGGGGETNQVAEEARGEPARLGLSGQPAAERSRQEGVAPAQVADEPAFQLAGKRLVRS